MAAAQSDASLRKYKKLSDRKHVLLRPDMYVGPTEPADTDMFVFEDGKIISKSVRVSPALIKIFDEVLVNARDHVTRCQNAKSENQVTKIDVTIDAPTGTFTVRNNGEGIDVAQHPEHKLWIPEMIFAHLRTSTTYEDEGASAADHKPRTIGGKNGYGAKLAFVFAVSSRIETIDAHRKKLYSQEFGKNLESVQPPKVSKCSRKPYTEVTVTPDLARLGGKQEKGFDAATMSVLIRRVYDLAAVTDKAVNVTLNGEKLSVRTLEHYSNLVLGADKTATPRVYERCNDRWEYSVALSQTHETQHISFANGVYTRLGGSHVKHVLDQICKRVADKANARRKDSAIKPAQVRPHIFLLLNAVINDPAFDSQTKETLTSPVSKFGSKAEVSDKFIDKVCKLGVLDRVTAIQGALNQAASSRTDGRKTRRITNIPKLDDAELAGGPKSHLCTLLLAEGDSAKTGIIGGLTAADRNYIGVFPLRGKLINVRGASAKQVNDNTELTQLKQILGLESGKTYTKEDLGKLRYGKVRIVTDQDKDGSHIKGLIANAFDVLWPSLLTLPGFLSYMNTPILKVKKGKGKSAQSKSFYSEADYRKWLNTPEARGSWDLKYYKGLGTSTGPEFKEYLANPMVVDFERESSDPKKLDRSLDLAFNAKRRNDRKVWIEHGSLATASTDEDSQQQIYKGTIQMKDFINGELRTFSLYDCDRSIPSAIDGLKTSQRKVLFSCFKRKLTTELKVAQLAGYVAEHSAYHHGEQSLNGTIINMAQDYTGSNNLNLLVPAGQFGSRHQGGSDSASPRYIFTHLSPLARYVFPEADDAVLDFLSEDGQQIEPAHYVPIIPMLLVNGCRAGIGTGYSSFVPCYDVREVIKGVRERLKPTSDYEDWADGYWKIEHRRWTPSYRGFKGTISVSEDGKKATTRGVISQIKGKPTHYRITEVPIKGCFQGLQNRLSELAEGKRGEEIVRDYKSWSTATDANFEVEFRKGAVANIEDVVKILKLEDDLSLTNMHAFSHKGRITKYSGPDDVIDAFMPVRFELYHKRKNYLIQILSEQARWLREQVKFIRAVCDGSLKIARRSDGEVEKDIVNLGVREGKVSDLLAMPMRSQTESKVKSLEAKLKEAEQELERVKATCEKQMWWNDLDKLEERLDTPQLFAQPTA